MQSTGGGSLTSRIESRRCDLVKFILVAHSRSTEHARGPANDVGSLTAAKQKAGCQVSGSLLKLFSLWDFAPRERPLIHAML
jgi:hypothetical protein